MSWLTEGTSIYNFKCTQCDAINPVEVDRIIPSEDVQELIVPCDDCQHAQCEYAGFEPRKMGVMTKIAFEKNGRLGVQTRFPNGSVVTMSKTKINAMEGKGHDSVLSKGCVETSNKVKKEISARLYSEFLKGVSK